MTAPLEVREFSVRLSRPLETATGRITKRTGFGIRLHGASSVGIGEATPLPGWTEPLPTCRHHLTSLARSSTDGSSAHDAVPADRPATRHGLQLASVDAGARAAGTTVAALLATSRPTASVPVAALIGSNDIDDATVLAERARRAGYPAIKCKVGVADIESDVERIRSVRAAVGSTVEVRADANRSWSLEEAQEALDGLSSADVRYVEEPIRDPTPARLERLSALGVGLALDETVCRRDFAIGEWAEVVDAVILKPMALGGLDRAMVVAASAAEWDLDIVVSNTVDAVVARTGAVHLAAALDTGLPTGLDTASRLAEDVAADPIELHDGHLSLPEAPGLGTLGPWDPTATEGLE